VLVFAPMTWYVYLLRCGDGTLYTGVTTEPGRRLAQHAAGRGAAYTRGRGPLAMVHLEPAADRGAALRRELAIKRMSREEKEAMVKRGRETAAATEFAGFGPGALRFMRGLARHNEKPWFEANRAVWEREVRGPMRALVEEMDVRLARLAPEIVGDPKRSLFRIHRDVRFSNDKRPYKTHAACWFFHHDAGRAVGREAAHGGAGFYFQIAPAPIGSYVGGGIWQPPRPTLTLIRDALVEDAGPLARIVRVPGFRKRYGGLDEDGMLTRLPRGYDAGTPAEPFLRHASFFAGRAMPEDEALGPGLVRVLEKDFAVLLPLVRWLNAAIGFPPAERR
jgi:uncharacterized protein (TIGR02453 family)